VLADIEKDVTKVRNRPPILAICNKAKCGRVSVLTLNQALNCRTESQVTKPSHHFCAIGGTEFSNRVAYKVFWLAFGVEKKALKFKFSTEANRK
jgi:hypothetical protein